MLLVKIAVNVVISIQWIVDYVAGVATFNLIARILGAVFMPLPLQRPAFLSLISTFIYLLIKLGAVIALVKVSTFFFNERKAFLFESMNCINILEFLKRKKYQRC